MITHTSILRKDTYYVMIDNKEIESYYVMLDESYL